MKTKTTILRAATLAALAVALLVGLPGIAAAGADDPPVMPVFHWIAESRQVIVTPPNQVILWMRGEIDDPDGSLASWKARYDRQRETPGFAWAILALQDLAREAADGGATPFQVEHEVIPRILEQRGDIRDGLYGRRLEPMWERCVKMEDGRWECRQYNPWISFLCEIWECVPCPGANECIATSEIECPDNASSPGHDLQAGTK